MTNLSQIVQQHGPIVWKTIRRLVNHDADGADCFQRTFVSALQVSCTQAVHNWPGLLKRLATARALEFLRQRYLDAKRLTTLVDDSAVDRRAVGPVQAAESSELAEHLRLALAELDVRQAQVFCLACLEGFSYREIADELGLTVSHVGVLLNRAKSGLREQLQAHGPAAEPFEKEVKS
jgi:RNA polymerase sigma-70 factor (ECF subfamily)